MNTTDEFGVTEGDTYKFRFAVSATRRFRASTWHWRSVAPAEGDTITLQRAR